MSKSRPSPSRSALIVLARRCQVTHPGAAAGRCLAASLTLALAARRRGIAVSLVRWKVRGDPDFADHWAVRLDRHRVLDLTRAQVDGTTRLVVDIDDYPADFVARRDYPASLFLERFGHERRADQTLLTSGFLLWMARERFRFDALDALYASLPARLLTIAGELVAAHATVLPTALRKRLEARRERLVRRIG